MAETSMQKMQEAMMAVTQRQGAPMFEQPVLPLARQHIAPPVKPTSTQQMIVDGLIWHVCSNCKRMRTHEDDDCWTSEMNAAKKEKVIE